MQPLQGIRIVEIGDSVATAMAGLVLAEAGAEVVRVEPEGGAPSRGVADGVDFALLNRGKRSVTANLDSGEAMARLRPLLESADVVIEGGRPGEMAELGLDMAVVRDANPTIVYCSVTGWGQDGPRANEAAQDLNYMGATGLLRASPDGGAPALPRGQYAAIGSGAYSCVINILLALRARDQGRETDRLDIAISDGLFAYAYPLIARAELSGGEALGGGSARYQIYATKDGAYVAVAATENRHWENLCERLELEEELRDDAADPEATRGALAAILGARNASFWRDKFENRDLCCSVIADLDHALADPQFRDRGLFDRKVRIGGAEATAVVVPVAGQFRSGEKVDDAPSVGEADELLGAETASTS
jgi:crotonobetainyl-CoA:carnitine CoA-transferase CaiB-like acyl-CoA transferase